MPPSAIDAPRKTDSTPFHVPHMFAFMEQQSLFPDPRRNATDEEVIHVLRIAIARGGRLPRMAELFLSGVCAEHLVDELHLADLEVVRKAPVRFHD